MSNNDAKKILIIEDEFPMRYLIEYQLKQNGYEVNLAKDGPDGLKAVQQNRPDLVLLDVMMPGMDGFEVCTQLKKNPETAEIPVIFVTASEVSDYRTRAFDVGAADYMTKPFRPAELVAQITAVLRQTQAIYEDVTLPDAPAEQQTTGHITALFSPKGGVGTTTVTAHLAEAITLYAERPVVLIDLDFPFGGLATHLHLFPIHDIVELLRIAPEYITISTIDEFATQYRENIFLLSAPGRLIDPETTPDIAAFHHVLSLLSENGYDILLDIGSHITPFTTDVLNASESIFVITSGESNTNQLINTFTNSADQLGLDPRTLMPVINEIHGAVRDVSLDRVPVARIPFDGDPSDTRLWLKEQGMRKMVTMLHP